MRPRALPLLFALVLPFTSRTAFASLTDSEKAIVRELVLKGDLDTAPKVRSLVARPDLEASESADLLRSAFASVPFDEKHQRFTESLLHGPGSIASRNALVPAVVDGLLARAEARMSDVPVESPRRASDKSQGGAREVIAIHAFVDARIANAGNPTSDGHDPTMAIRDDALRACVTRYTAYVSAHERWFKHAGSSSPDLVRVRTQVDATVVDLARGISSRHEVSQALGLSDARRSLFERRGVLLEPDDTSKEAPLASAATLLDSVPRAAEGLSVWMLSAASTTDLVARGRIQQNRVSFSDKTWGADPDALWAEEVFPSQPDANTTTLAGAVAELAVARAMAVDPAFAERARRASAHVARAGAPGLLAVSVAKGAKDAELSARLADPVRVAAGAAQLLLLDGERAVELALIRGANQHPEAIEQLSVGLAVLASGGSRATLGHVREDGTVEPVDATEVHVEDGVATRFVLGGKHYALTPDDDGAFSATIDGKAPKLTTFSAFRVRTAPGESFRVDGVDYTRLFGEPRAAGLDDGRLVVEGGKGGFDALVTGAATSGDVHVSAVVKATGTGGAILARATAGDSSYAGLGLVLQPDTKEARLLSFNGRGQAVPLADAVPLPAAPADGYTVSLDIVKDKVTAKVGDRVVSANVPAELGEGRAGLAARSKGWLDVRRFKLTAKAAR
jgi:hypothetical protein